jgi:hypothetical protein
MDILMAEIAPRLQEFWVRRNRLLATLDEVRDQIDTWFLDPETAVPSIPRLAQLEGLLANRKSLLTDLVRLDDEMLETLVKVRGAQS